MVYILLPPAVLIWDGRRLLYPNFIALVGHSYAASLTVSVLSSGTVPTTTSDLFELLNLKTDGHWSTQSAQLTHSFSSTQAFIKAHPFIYAAFVPLIMLLF